MQSFNSKVNFLDTSTACLWCLPSELLIASFVWDQKSCFKWGMSNLVHQVKKLTNMVIVVWVSILFSNLWVYLNNLTMGISLLAILKINGEQLLQIQDDGGFLKYV